MKKCPKCGTENPDEAKFCKKCGNNLENIPSGPSSLKDILWLDASTKKGKKAILYMIVGAIIFTVTIVSVFYIFELGVFSPEKEKPSANLSAHWDLTLGGSWWLETRIEFKNPTENDIQIESMELKTKLTDEWIERQDLNSLVSEVPAGSKHVIYQDNILALLNEEVTYPWKYKAIIYTSRGKIVTNTVKPEVE